MTAGPGAAPDWSRALAAVGGFFAVDVHPRDALLPAPWEPLSVLVDDPDRLSGRIARVRSALAERGGIDPTHIPWRVAASLAHLGVLARALSVGIAATAAGLPVTVVELSGLWWVDALGGPYPLSVPDHPRVRRGSDDPGPLLDRLAAPITDSVLAAGPVAPRVLWGNVASAISSAITQLDRHDIHWANRARGVVEPLFGDERLRAETGELGVRFRRTSCCLLYLADTRRGQGRPEPVCGDCVLLRSAVRSADP